MELCVVFVCNRSYLNKFKLTLKRLRSVGDYSGDVCLVVGDDLKTLTNNTLEDDHVIIKHFPNLPILSDKSFLHKQKSLKRPNHWFGKIFQFHKFNIFHKFFKKWKYIFYLDCGMHIYDKIQPIIECCKENTLLANRDGVDNETASWCIPISPGNGLKLGDQFVKEEDTYNELQQKYNLNEAYFQTTVMLYDTSIIDDNTFLELCNLVSKYPISITNDQAIIALYFTQLKPCWEQIKRELNNDLYSYDYVRCVDKKYIMVKNDSNKWLSVGYNS